MTAHSDLRAKATAINLGGWWPSQREFSKVLGNGLPELFAVLTPTTVLALLDRIEALETALGSLLLVTMFDYTPEAREAVVSVARAALDAGTPGGET